MDAASLLLSLACLSADDPWLVEAWTTLEGLPQNTINAIAIAPDRSLWLATFGGVARFDGERFEAFSRSEYPDMPSDRVTTLVVGDGGEVWFGTQDDGVARLRDGRCQPYAAGLESLEIERLLLDAEGRLLAATRSGLARLEGERFEPLAFTGTRVQDLALRGDGTLVAATERGTYALGAAGPRRLAAAPSAALLVLADDTVLVATSAGSLVRCPPGGEAVAEPAPPGVSCLAEGRDGGVLLGLADGLARLGGAGAERLWSEEHVRAGVILPDDEGTWVGGMGTGLRRLRPSPLRGIPLAPYSASFLAAEPSGRLLIGRRRGEDELEAPFSVDPMRNAPAVADLPPAAAAGPAREGLLLSRPGQLLRLAGDELAPLSTGGAFGPAEVPGPLLEDRAGAVWAGREDGAVVRLEGGRARRFGPAEGLTAGERAHVFLEDSRGRLWIGGPGGLYRFEGAGFRAWSAGAELPPAAVRTLLEDEEGALWGGTYGGGLFRLTGDGRIERVGMGQGLREDVVTQIAPAGPDHVLLLGNRGLTRVRWSELREVVEGRRGWLQTEEHRSAPGMPFIEGDPATPACAVLPDGRVGLVTISGLLLFDPSLASSTMPVTRARIDRVLVDGERRALGELSAIPPRRREVTFDFAPCTLVDPVRIPLRYRLLGHDERWVEARGRRSVTWAGLAPGDYELQVEVSGSQAPPASLAFTVVPSLHETTAFRVLAGLAAAGLLALVLRSQRRAASRRARTLERKVAERTRDLAGEVDVRLRIEAELRESRDTLEERVQARTVELAEALRQLHMDVERRKLLEQKLLEAQKLESVGRLAGGVAHDFNNLLTVILGTAEEVQARAEGQPGLRAVREDMETILDAGHRGADLIRRLLAFARRQPVEPREIDVRAELEDLQPLLQRLLGHKSRLELSLGEGEFPVVIDPVHLEQIVLNLVANAGDAMPEGGTVRVELARASGETLSLRVSDAGPGIPPEIRAKVFEPFFSTKPSGKGTGLGLSTCYGLVRSMGGSIDVESAPAGGTSLVVRLPVRTVERRGEDAPHLHRILVVDDQPAVLATLRRTLERSGWKVRTASSSAEALALCDHEPFDVLLSDVDMPDKSGAELARELALVHPELPVVLMTGHVPESQAVLAGIGTILIHKPIETDQLLAALRRATRRGRERAVSP